ncbi:MAG: hypothetical protein K2X43_01105 [Hyphomonadaceae bacterium]|nr:hypothetical protein [Hyphomonadaceae bacterium]
MSSKIKPEVETIIARHEAIDWRKPPHDPERVRAAYERRLKATKLTRQVRLITDPADAWAARDAWDAWDARAARDAWDAWAARDAWDAWDAWAARDAWDAWDARAARAARDAWDAWAARDARDAIGWLNITEPDELVLGLIEVYAPMIDAFEGGAFGHILGEHEILVLASPAIHTRDRRLHREDGPALEWPKTKLWYWKGINVPQWLIEEPQKITADKIRSEANAEIRRAMIERFGYGRYMRELGGKMIHEDATGKLWKNVTTDMHGTDIAVVEVLNGSLEPDGTRKTYHLSVPPTCRTAKAAVAWTYGMTEDEYDKLVVRT